MPVQQPSHKVAGYQTMFSDPAVNAKREQDAAREREAIAKRAVRDLRKITAKALGAELDDAALAALADKIARSLGGFTIDRTVPVAIIREMLPAYLASLAES
jgi:hypothetical protein